MKLERGVRASSAALLILVAATATLAATTPSANAASQIRVFAKADPGARQAEIDSESDHDPYVLFALTGARKGSKYRIVVQTSPSSTAAKPCNPGLTTSFMPVLPNMPNGRVVFDPEPVTSGHYFPFAGNEPCHGKYILAVHEQPRGARFKRVLTFAFSYPSLGVKYLPPNPHGS